jgi:hypothetical protein
MASRFYALTVTDDVDISRLRSEHDIRKGDQLTVSYRHKPKAGRIIVKSRGGRWITTYATGGDRCVGVVIARGRLV